MAHKFFIFLFFVIVHSAAADTWVRSVGSRLWETASGFTKTRDGGFVLAGGAIGPDLNDSDPLLVKFDSKGAVKWQKTFSVEGLKRGANTVQGMAGGGFIVTAYDVLMKITRTGDVEWTRMFTKAVLLFARGTSDHGAIVSGYRNGKPWVAKLDAGAAVQWEYTYACISSEVATSVIETSDGNFIVGALTRCKAPFYGVELLKIDPSGHVLWQKIYSNSNSDVFESHYLLGISETDDAGYVMALNAAYRVKILKLDAQGDIIWNRLYDMDVGASATPTDIQQTPDGGYVFAHVNHLLKVNGTGEVSFHKVFGRRPGFNFTGLSQEKDGSYVLAASMIRHRRGTDFVLLKVDQNGNLNSPCVRVRDLPFNSETATIEVFSNTGVNVRSVKSSVRDIIVTPGQFVSDQNSCNSN